MATVLSNLGEEWAADRLAGTGTYAATTGTHVGWGTGAGTAAKTDTTLFSESADPAARAAVSISVTGTGATAKYQAQGTLTSATTQTITNAGLFTASTAGTMFIKGDFTGVALNSGDSIQFTITVDPS